MYLHIPHRQTDALLCQQYNCRLEEDQVMTICIYHSQSLWYFVSTRPIPYRQLKERTHPWIADCPWCNIPTRACIVKMSCRHPVIRKGSKKCQSNSYHLTTIKINVEHDTMKGFLIYHSIIWKSTTFTLFTFCLGAIWYNTIVNNNKICIKVFQGRLKSLPAFGAFVLLSL